MHLPHVFTLLIILNHSCLLFSSRNNYSVAKHYCGSSLSDALFSICKKTSPRKVTGLVTHFAPRVDFNRSTGGIIEECCINRCSNEQLSQYCQTKIGRISKYAKSKKRDRSQRFVDTNKILKNKRNPAAQCACTCGKRSSKKNLRMRFTPHQRKGRLIGFNAYKNLVTPTTEKQVVAEAQYIDDWIGEEAGGEPFLVNSQ